jgi:hypothetical protein
MKTYFPYKSDRKDKKFYIITDSGKKVHFGAKGYQHFTEGHIDENRRIAYENRHMKNEDWNKSGIDTAGFWSYWFLWKYKTYNEALTNIKKKYL